MAKNVLAAGLFALVDGFDLGFTIRGSIQSLTGRSSVNLTLATDSRSLFCLAVTLGQTTERRLLIDLSIIREACEKREITEVVWLSGDSNPADDLTKIDKRNGTLAKIISTNNFNPKIESCVDRYATEVKPMEIAAEG